MTLFGNIVGITAVVLYILSYQMKQRMGIILCNATSRVLYVVQYLLLGAFEGALLDVVAFFVSLLCCLRHSKFVKKHFVLTVVLSNVLIVAIGMLTYKNIFSLLPIFGVVFETLAFWLKNERNIRILSLIGAPPWLIYNLMNLAYGSAIGNMIAIVSIVVAIVRYDILGKKRKMNSGVSVEGGV